MRDNSANSLREILQALEAGASTQALTLSLQLLGKENPSFLSRAMKLLRPATPDEAWRMAYRTYTRHRKRILAAASLPPEDAIPLFQAAAQDCSAIYNIGGSMARKLALAVCEALEEEYTAVRRQADPPSAP